MTSINPGVPIAMAIKSFDRETARTAAAGLRDASCGTKLGGIKIKDLVDEGRS